MGNKQNLQLNNADLQAIKKAINSLPSAKPWGGGTIIEPSSEDVIIPAFTNVELTVQGDMNLKPENIKYGETIFGVSGVYSGVPIQYEYTGQSQITYDHVIIDGITRFCFTLKLLSSGMLNVMQIGVPYTDVYLVGGGGSGGVGNGGGGGGGGYFASNLNFNIKKTRSIPLL